MSKGLQTMERLAAEGLQMVSEPHQKSREPRPWSQQSCPHPPVDRILEGTRAQENGMKLGVWAGSPGNRNENSRPSY